MEKLKLQADSSSYSVQFSNENTVVKLDGGASRVRKTMIKGTHTVNITLKLNPKSYQYFMAFYRKSTSNGAKKFLMDLIIDGLKDEYVCVMLPNSLQLQSQTGNSYVIVYTVEAEQKEHNVEDDERIIAGFKL
jgi:hypothetical protein